MPRFGFYADRGAIDRGELPQWAQLRRRRPDWSDTSWLNLNVDEKTDSLTAVVRASSGCGAACGGFRLGGDFALSRNVPGYKALQVVAKRPVGTEGLFVKQTLDTAPQTDLIGVLLRPDRPTHSAMPATAEDHYGRACQPGGQQTQGPTPRRLLLLLTHLPQPVSPYNYKGYAQSESCAMGLEMLEPETLTYQRAGEYISTLVMLR